MGMDSVKGVAQAVSMQPQTLTQTKNAAQPKQADTAAEQYVQQAQSATQKAVVSTKAGDGTQDSKTGSDSKRDMQSDIEAMKNVAKDVNKIINKNTIAEFGYHEETHRITIKIKDKDTDEIIKEIPSEKALELLEKAWELAGILVDEKR